MSYTANNKRIAKNTLALYLRTFITTLVTLYTSRVVLQTLGVENFGLYNIVGGVVVLFSFITAAMTSATQRFLNFELGRGGDVRRMFSMSMTLHLIIAAVVFVLAETLGLWFVSTMLNIPQGRMEAAHWVYQFSVLATCVGIVRVPYNALIIAHEQMGFYAYMSILESVMKLVIVYILVVIAFDKLIIYGILTFAVILIVTVVYKIYCNRVFEVSHYRYFWNKALFRELISFTSWSLFGGAANIGATQGVNIILNIFYGVVVNAAMGIATQVMTAVNSFVSNFQVAFNPQLVKSYAAGEYQYFESLIFKTSRLSFYLLLIPVIPIIICADPILNIWLVNTPQYSVPFIQLAMFSIAIEAISGPLVVAVQTVGRIRVYQIIISVIIILSVPLTYLFIKLGYSPISAMAVRVLVQFMALIFRIVFLKKQINLPVRNYTTQVLLRCLFVLIIAVPLPLLVFYYTRGIILTTATSILINFVVIVYIGLNKNERIWVYSLLPRGKNAFQTKLRRYRISKKIKSNKFSIVNVWQSTTPNLGDLVCSPSLYFQDLTRDAISMSIMDFTDKIQLRNKVIIVGGGGLFQSCFESRINNINRIAQYNKVIFWGVGFDHKVRDTKLPDFDLSASSQVAIRDYNYNDFNYVPCPSCMSSLFDTYKNRKIEDGYLLYLHGDYSAQIENDLCEIPCYYNTRIKSLDEALKVLSSCEIVITNSFHGMYWATLLGKKVIVIPWIDTLGNIGTTLKFKSIKYPPVYLDDWKKYKNVSELISYPDSLDECRELNIKFYQFIYKNYINYI